ncbi:thioredoxin domain-containing protein [Roseivirga misakiensis]|nr:thioredoxin domain-containing protein [Roseivirga misakiensis]
MMKKNDSYPFRLFGLIIGILILYTSCDSRKEQEVPQNRLAKESSLYLLQHSTNPVDWYPWGDEAFEKAKSEDKLVVISIGYYACHWCQVMEKETFMDTTVAKLMNDSYVSIKVDREERPDIDQVYADAARKMTGSAGWPLNIIATSDGTPLFAGTYFENEDWQAVLQRADYLYQENPEEILNQAESMAASLKEKSSLKGQGIDITLADIEGLWLSQSDTTVGGIKGTQKFPNSPYLSALLDFTYYRPNKDLDKFLKQTLDNMALGGMFDHLNGGFARYSTDKDWKVPHFEKMLYDNAQLMAVYAKAYRKFNDPFYLYIAESTANCLLTEFKRESGGFYSSINAVSNEVEGGYYTWTLSEIQEFDDAATLKLFNISEAGNWENGQNVLFANGSTKQDYLAWTKSDVKAEILSKRSRRTSPPKDKKIITSWNALAIEGFVSLYRATQNTAYLNEGKNLATYLTGNHLNSDNNSVTRTDGSLQNGFLQDYAQLSASLISLYQVTFNLNWIESAEAITAEMVERFNADNTALFKQSSAKDDLFMASYPTLDSDLPSGNAQAAENLILLAELFYDTRSEWKDKAVEMLSAENSEMQVAPAFTGKWIQSLIQLQNPSYEVAILGSQARNYQEALDLGFRPDIIFLGGTAEGSVPLLANKLVDGRTTIYVCQNKTCKFPTEDVEEAYRMTLEPF